MNHEAILVLLIGVGAPSAAAILGALLGTWAFRRKRRRQEVR